MTGSIDPDPVRSMDDTVAQDDGYQYDREDEFGPHADGWVYERDDEPEPAPSGVDGWPVGRRS